MYRAYINGDLFFDTTADIDELALASASLNLQLGGAGTFNFTVEENNVCYDDFDSPKSYVDVYRNNTLLWSGRVITPTQNFYKSKSVTCEGLFAVLNDSVYRAPVEPFNGTLDELIELLLDSHNEQVEAEKQIHIRNITVSDDYLYREYENVESTMKRLQDLTNAYGGYMSVQKVGGLLYFDWLAEPETIAEQTITVTSISSITKTATIKDIITVLIPLGAEQELPDGTKRRLTISDVNGGLDYIENTAGVEAFGRINSVEIWDDVTNASILKAKGQAFLAQKAQRALSLSITAVDLADIGTEGITENLAIGERIRVTVDHLDIDDLFAITTQSLNLLAPESNSITVGASGLGYVGRTANKEAIQNARITQIMADYASNQRVSEINDRIISAETSIEQNGNMIQTTASALRQTNSTVEALQTLITQNAESIEALIRSNNQIALALRIDENGVTIGKQDDPVYSRQTNNAYQFVDSGANRVLLEINTLGIETPTVSAKEQIAFLAGDTPQWAIRKGEDDANGHYNLNDIWIGG